jgi:hypothetical protein
MKEYVNPPKCCDICEVKIKDRFFDGRTLRGPWANMCLTCYVDYGYGPDFVTVWMKNDQNIFVKREVSQC